MQAFPDDSQLVCPEARFLSDDTCQKQLRQERRGFLNGLVATLLGCGAAVLPVARVQPNE
jgi:hypothetical protein